MCIRDSVASVLAQLQELKAMGVQAVTVEVGFPMLYEPFFSSQPQYQQFVTFYQNVAASVRAAGLKLIVENECLLNDSVVDGWNPAAFYATLNWTQYQAARAQTAVTIAQTMQPDYMVAVSYTHLDVYKRQRSDRYSSPCPHAAGCHPAS